MNNLYTITVFSPPDAEGGWEYKEANTTEYTHCFHIYPAMMIPQIARRILNKYSVKTGSLLFDP